MKKNPLLQFSRLGCWIIILLSVLGGALVTAISESYYFLIAGIFNAIVWIVILGVIELGLNIYKELSILTEVNVRQYKEQGKPKLLGVKRIGKS